MLRFARLQPIEDIPSAVLGSGADASEVTELRCGNRHRSKIQERISRTWQPQMQVVRPRDDQGARSIWLYLLDHPSCFAALFRHFPRRPRLGDLPVTQSNLSRLRFGPCTQNRFSSRKEAVFFTCRSRVRGHVARIQRRLAPALAIAAGGSQWFVLGAVMLSDVAEAAGSGCGQKAQGWRGATDALSSSPTWPGHFRETKVRHAALSRGPSKDWGCLGHRWLAKGRKR